jgi:hypothetical protein
MRDVEKSHQQQRRRREKSSNFVFSLDFFQLTNNLQVGRHEHRIEMWSIGRDCVENILCCDFSGGRKYY